MVFLSEVMGPLFKGLYSFIHISQQFFWPGGWLVKLY